MKPFFQFLAWPIVCGLLIALLLLQLLPQLRPHEQDQPANNTEHHETRKPWQGPASYSLAVKRTAPAVVNIYTSKIIKQQLHPFFGDPVFRHFFNRGNAPQQERIQRSLGSGVIVSPEGYLLTNHHVIKDADKILVALYDGRETFADIVGSDPDTDLAVLKIDMPNLLAAPINEAGKMEVGDVVLAIGNPFGFEQSVSQGIISATGRHGLNLNTYENFIQTDAAINPGNSGGALINAYGDLIGINSAIWSKSGGSQGIGLAIPIDTATAVMMEIMQYGRVIRGWLGMEGRQFLAKQPSSSQVPPTGIIVTNTHPSGPAAQAGVLPGDLIVELNGEKVDNAYRIMQRVAQIRPGKKVHAIIIRDGKRLAVDIAVWERPSAK